MPVLGQAHVTAGSYGYQLAWEVDLHVDLSGSPVLGECALAGPLGRRIVQVTLDVPTRQLRYTVGRYELDRPGVYMLSADIAVSAGYHEIVAHSFTVYPAARAAD